MSELLKTLVQDKITTYFDFYVALQSQFRILPYKNFAMAIKLYKRVKC